MENLFSKAQSPRTKYFSAAAQPRDRIPDFCLPTPFGISQKCEEFEDGYTQKSALFVPNELADNERCIFFTFICEFPLPTHAAEL